MLVVFATSNLTVFSNIFEVLQNNDRTRGGVGNETLAQDVVTIPVETRLTPSQFLEMTFSGFTPFGLQFSLQTEMLTIKLFPATMAKKVMLGCDSRMIQSKVDPDNLITLRNIRFRDTHHDMQPVLSFAHGLRNEIHIRLK